MDHKIIRARSIIVIVGGGELVAVEQINFPFFTATDKQMRISSSSLIGQKHHAAGAKVGIRCPLSNGNLIPGSEIIGHRQAISRGELDKAGAVFGAARTVGRVENSVAGFEIEVGVGVHGQSPSGHPDSSLASEGAIYIGGGVRSGIEDVVGELLKGGGVVTDDPAVVRIGIGIAGVGHI